MFCDEKQKDTYLLSAPCGTRANLAAPLHDKALTGQSIDIDSCEHIMSGNHVQVSRRSQNLELWLCQ